MPYIREPILIPPFQSKTGRSEASRYLHAIGTRPAWCRACSNGSTRARGKAGLCRHAGLEPVPSQRRNGSGLCSWCRDFQGPCGGRSALLQSVTGFWACIPDSLDPRIMHYRMDDTT